MTVIHMPKGLTDPVQPVQLDHPSEIPGSGASTALVISVLLSLLCVIAGIYGPSIQRQITQTFSAQHQIPLRQSSAY